MANSTSAGDGPDRERALALVDDLMSTDFTMAYEVLVADEETVACQWRFRGRHADSGNPVDVLAADFFTIRDGRLTSLLRFLDFAEFRGQLKGRRRTAG